MNTHSDMRGKWRHQRNPELLTRIATMKAMRASGSTLEQIGVAFKLTKERIRQLIGSMPKPPAPKPWPRTYFARIMKRWLWDAGFRRCSSCKLWTSEVTVTCRTCRECNRRNARAFQASERGREYLRTWQRTHREQRAAAKKRWFAKHPEKVAEYHKRWYVKNREKLLEKPRLNRPGKPQQT